MRNGLSGSAQLVASAAIGLVAMALPAFAADTTSERLRDTAKEPQNWLTVHHDYNNSRHSPLAEINRNNIKNLRPKFIFSIGGRATGGTLPGKEESTPLVEDGFMYVSDTWARVMKFDVRSGNAAIPLWRYDPKITKSRTNRGIALFGDKVIVSTNDTRIIALNKETGQVAWEVVASAPTDPATGTPSAKTQAFTGAPLAIRTAGGRDLILQGESTGGQLGTRSWVGAFDANDGKLVWRTFTIPAPGEPGSETWKDNHNAWRIGGGGVWQTASYDPATNLLYYGTGDAFPSFDPQFRPGDNLFTASTIALDADTGKIVWYFQETPNEHWDFDTPSPKMLYDVNINGESRKVVANFSRNGYYYTLDRNNGQFLRADQYQEKITWTKGIDPKTGKPVDYNPNTPVQVYAGIGVMREKPGQEFLSMVERCADLLPADARYQAHGRLRGRRRRLHLDHGQQDSDGREEGLRRAAAVLHRAGPHHRPRRAVGDRPSYRQGDRQGDVPAADRVGHAFDRRRPSLHRAHDRQVLGL